MNKKMSRLVKSILLIMGLVVGVFCLMPFVQSGPPSYLDFIKRDKKFYEEIARACDDLILVSQTNSFGKRILSGDSSQLPKAIQNLKASKVHVYSNYQVGTDHISRVHIKIEDIWKGYGINWGLVDYGNGQLFWELSSDADGLHKTHFSVREKLAPGDDEH